MHTYRYVVKGFTPIFTTRVNVGFASKVILAETRELQSIHDLAKILWFFKTCILNGNRREY